MAQIPIPADLPKTRLSSSQSKSSPSFEPDKRKSMLLKERDFYLNPKNRASLSTLGKFKEVCLVSSKWHSEYLAYLEGQGVARKMPPVNSDLIVKETVESRCAKRAEDKHGLNEILRPELKACDFVLIDEELMDYLISRFHGHKLKRPVLSTPSGNPFIEYLPQKVKLIVLTRKDLLNPNALQKAFNNWKLIQAFPSTRLQAFKADLSEILRYSCQLPQATLSFFRVWSSSQDLNTLFEALRSQTSEFQNDPNLSGFAIEAENLEYFSLKTLKELRVSDDSLLIIEVKALREEPWFLNIKEKKSVAKRSYLAVSGGELPEPDELSNPSQRPASLRSLRWVSLSSFDFRAEAIRYELLFPNLSPQAKGLTGLLNLTNTCYMNSALQCLSHTRELRTYFLDRSFHNDISLDNPIGTKGDSAYAFAILVRRLWLEKTPFFSPNFMKILFQKHAQLSGFARNEQHDSQEFLHAFMDALNEDLKRERAEKERKGEKIAGWMGYFTSSVSELFLGVLKNTVKCPECHVISNNFEPFLNLSLHFPSTGVSPQKIAVFNENAEQEPRLVGYEPQWLDLTPNGFKEKLACPKKAELCFILATRNTVQMTHETENQTVKELLPARSGFLALFETAERLKIEESVYSLTLTRFLSTSQTFATSEFFRPIRLSRKWGSISIFQAVFAVFSRILKKIGVFSFGGTGRFKLRLRLFDRKTQISICENCLASDYCVCEFSFPSLNAIENKYRFSDYSIFFEICLDWDSLSQSEVKAFDSIWNSQETTNLVKPASKGKEFLSIYDFLRFFRNPEVLCSQNAWFCNKCKKNQRATTQMEVFSAPKVLILHLKRFRNQKNIKAKISMKIIYPLENLDLREYVVESLLPEELVERKLNGDDKVEKNEKPLRAEKTMNFEGEEKTERFFKSEAPEKEKNAKSEKNERKPIFYDLYAVINHHGGNMSCGHYTAICKSEIDGKWYKFDDKMVYEVSEGSVCNNDAYVLFYRRKGD